MGLIGPLWGLQHLVFLEGFVDLIHGDVNLLMGVGSHQSNADEGLVAGHSGSDDGSHEDAILQQVVGDGEGLGIVADEEGDDGGGGVADFKSQILEGLEGYGIKVDKEKNTDSCSVPVKDITAADSKVKILVIPTNEELVIARETKDVVTK